MIDDAEVFKFLDALRQGGKINMFNAPAVLEQSFDFSRKDAIDVFWRWTKTYSAQRVCTNCGGTYPLDQSCGCFDNGSE